MYAKKDIILIHLMALRNRKFATYIIFNVW